MDFHCLYTKYNGKNIHFRMLFLDKALANNFNVESRVDAKVILLMFTRRIFSKDVWIFVWNGTTIHLLQEEGIGRL